MPNLHGITLTRGAAAGHAWDVVLDAVIRAALTQSSPLYASALVQDHAGEVVFISGDLHAGADAAGRLTIGGTPYVASNINQLSF
jgi:hypothetical protein